jgi:flagellin
MSLAIKQILSQDRQAESRAYKKPFAASDHTDDDKNSGSVDDQHVDYRLSLQNLTDTRSINQNLRNANDGVSMVQIADDALAQTDHALDEIRRIAKEQYQLNKNDPDKIMFWLKQVDEISKKTNFNQKPLLDGNFADELYTIGSGVEQQVEVSLSSSSPAALGFGSNIEEVLNKLRDKGIAELLPASDKQKPGVIEEAKESVSEIRATLPPLHERFTNAIKDLNRLADETHQAHSRIDDPTVATQVTAQTRDTLLNESKTSLQAQANQQPKIAMSLLE